MSTAPAGWRRAARASIQVLCRASIAAAAALAGCALWRPVHVPILTTLLPAACARPVDTLLVFLPGIYARPDAFVDEGLVGRLRERGVAADVLLVDAHVGYYSDRSILDRLEADVVAPARGRGYAHVWLVGISLGGFGALSHAAVRAAPGELDGVVVLAPYLGDERVWKAVASSGGLAGWPAPVDLQPPNELDQALWRWLQRVTRAGADVGAAGAADAPPIWIGWGADDRFAASSRLLASGLPSSHVAVAPGGHDWATWRVLWDALLPRLPWPTDASCRTRRSAPAAP